MVNLQTKEEVSTLRQSQLKTELLQKEFSRTQNIMKEICYADETMIFQIYNHKH